MMLKTVLRIRQHVEVEWDSLAMRDLKTEAEAFRNFSESLIALNDAEMVSKISSNNVLGDLLPDILPFDVDDERVEKARISAEVAEKRKRAQELMDQQREMMEDADREAGISAAGGSGGTDPDAG